MSLDVAVITPRKYPICARIPCIEEPEPHDMIIDLMGKYLDYGLITIIRRGSDAVPLVIDGWRIRSIICSNRDKCMEWTGDKLIINGYPLSIYLSVLYDEFLSELIYVRDTYLTGIKDRRSKYCVDKIVEIVLSERRRGASITLMGLEALMRVGKLDEVSLPKSTLQVLQEAGVVDNYSLIHPQLLSLILSEVKRRVYP
jgi:hypothetical protein